MKIFGYPTFFMYIVDVGKICIQCNDNKLLSEFSKLKNSIDGLQYTCKSCQHIQQKEWYQKNKLKHDLNNQKERRSEGYGVYILTHIPTQTYYIGEGWIHNRRKGNFSQLKKGRSSCGGLQRFFNNHPNIDEWEFKVIKKWKNKTPKGRELESNLITKGKINNPELILNIKI
jgi:hypothetical protein